MNIEYPGTRKEQRPHVIRTISETGGLHFILYSNLRGVDIDAVIATEKAYFGNLGRVKWKVYEHDFPPDLRQRLAVHGFEIDEPEAVMVLDLEEAAPWNVPELPPGVILRRLDDPAQLDDVRQVEETVWAEDMPWISENLAADLAVPDYVSIYAAYVAERPVCAGWINFHANGRFADLWGGSTLVEHRKKGLYAAILARRVQEARARGYRFLVTDASPMSRPILAKHGFEQLTRAWDCSWGRDTRE